jgi:hypothetical protein
MISKIAYIRKQNKNVYVPEGTTITWVEKPSVIVNLKTKTKIIGFGKCFKTYTKNQLPIFQYLMKKDEVLIIRGKKDYVYQVSNKKMNIDKIFRHPQDLKF